jgi:hypothetical protein
VQHEPGRLREAAAHRREVLWLEALSRTGCTPSSPGTVASIVLRNFRNSIARWLAQGADDLAGLDVQRGVETGRAVALVVVVRCALGVLRSIGKVGAVRSNAWICDSWIQAW